MAEKTVTATRTTTYDLPKRADIVTHPANDAYRENWDRIFGKRDTDKKDAQRESR